VANYHARVVTSPEGLADEDIDVERVTTLSGGRFPLLWLNITYNPDRLPAQQLTAIEQRHQLALLETARSNLDFL
jgi:hypothetical protein